ALGIVDGYYEAHMNSWDALAGSLLIEEAGGKVNDYLANNGLLEGNLVCTAAPELWETLAKIDG
ncbi:inositol monophosphatase, partial [Marinomonas agarivorans]